MGSRQRAIALIGPPGFLRRNGRIAYRVRHSLPSIHNPHPLPIIRPLPPTLHTHHIIPAPARKKHPRPPVVTIPYPPPPAAHQAGLLRGHTNHTPAATHHPNNAGNTCQFTVTAPHKRMGKKAHEIPYPIHRLTPSSDPPEPSPRPHNSK